MNARLFPVIVGVLLAVFGLGLVTPPKAQAGDLGKVLLGVAAGAILYGLLSDNDRNCERYWDGGHNRWAWHEKNWDQGHNRYAWRDRPDLNGREARDDRGRGDVRGQSAGRPQYQPQPQFNQGGRADDHGRDQGRAGRY
jgi:hypothetical protein